VTTTEADILNVKTPNKRTSAWLQKTYRILGQFLISYSFSKTKKRLELSNVTFFLIHSRNFMMTVVNRKWFLGTARDIRIVQKSTATSSDIKFRSMTYRVAVMSTEYFSREQNEISKNFISQA
jgi:hypothetical protein